jgi:hypothetical protein
VIDHLETLRAYIAPHFESCMLRSTYLRRIYRALLPSSLAYFIIQNKFTKAPCNSTRHSTNDTATQNTYPGADKGPCYEKALGQYFLTNQILLRTCFIPLQTWSCCSFLNFCLTDCLLTYKSVSTFEFKLSATSCLLCVLHQLELDNSSRSGHDTFWECTCR